VKEPSITVNREWYDQVQHDIAELVGVLKEINAVISDVYIGRLSGSWATWQLLGDKVHYAIAKHDKLDEPAPTKHKACPNCWEERVEPNSDPRPDLQCGGCGYKWREGDEPAPEQPKASVPPEAVDGLRDAVAMNRRRLGLPPQDDEPAPVTEDKHRENLVADLDDALGRVKVLEAALKVIAFDGCQYDMDEGTCLELGWEPEDCCDPCMANKALAKHDEPAPSHKNKDHKTDPLARWLTETDGAHLRVVHTSDEYWARMMRLDGSCAGSAFSTDYTKAIKGAVADHVERLKPGPFDEPAPDQPIAYPPPEGVDGLRDAVAMNRRRLGLPPQDDEPAPEGGES
jgi:hypothetical protein